MYPVLTCFLGIVSQDSSDFYKKVECPYFRKPCSISPIWEKFDLVKYL